MASPDAREFAVRGALYAIADGVSGCDHGDRAAQYAVRGVISDYYATPETWAPGIALDKVLSAHNRWLRAQREGGHGSLVTTLSLLALRGPRYCIAHVGDTRIYRLRNARLECLTTDHVWDHPELSHVLTRAIGMDSTVLVDYHEGDWLEGDVFLLLTDGIWAYVPEKELLHLLHLYRDEPEAAARALCEAALAAGSSDNASAIAVQTRATPSANIDQRIAGNRHLPLPGVLRAGQLIDGFRVEQVLHESRETCVYRVVDNATQDALVLKTLSSLADDDEHRAALQMEEWLASRLPSQHFPSVRQVSVERRQHLYYLTSFHAGATLARRQRNGQHFDMHDAVALGLQLTRALGALHRFNIVHRDIKPENLHLGADSVLRILDPGVAFCPGVQERSLQSNPGTPSYMPPERFRGEAATPSGDLYAAGVTLYHLLSNRYPYGEIEPFQSPRFGDPVPVSRYRPDTPLWLDNLLLRAVARDPENRFETAEEMRLALERGELQALNVQRRSPLLQQDPTVLWRTTAIFSLVLNLLLLWLLLAS